MAAAAGAPSTTVNPGPLSKAMTGVSQPSDAPALRPPYHRDDGIRFAATTVRGFTSRIADDQRDPLAFMQRQP